MELTNQTVSDLFLAKGDMSLGFEQEAPIKAALEHTVQDITAQIVGLGEGKLNLYVPSEAIIEPISPAEVTTEESAPALSTYESIENGIPNHNFQTNNISDPGMQNELIAVNSLVLNSNPSEVQEDSDATADIAPCDVSLKDTSSNSTALGETKLVKKVASCRKIIPQKKDRMEPLKMDMSKPTVIPLTSSQLSLQCLECHIIFSDDRSKQRHLKMNHPSEYEQCMLGDALFACYVCDRHFTCSTELMAHQRSHTEKQPFKCPICGEAFSRSSELTSHKKVHYNKQGYTCSDCGKLFKTLTLLKYHQRVHTGERPYVCIHKECGKRFTMPKALQKHLEAHEKEQAEGVENLTNATSKTRKKRTKGSASRKYACSQCNEFFKTAKSMLHHNKTKHSSCPTIPPFNSAVAARSPCLATLTEVVQLPLPHVDASGQAVQQIGPLEAEQIKRLIEKMGNVQKVNQLVILGMDQLPLRAQGSEMQQPQGLIQPLHFDFTQPTVEQAVCQPAKDKKGHEETATEQNALLESLGIQFSVEQMKTLLQDNTTISAKCPEKQVLNVESNMIEEQVNGGQYHVLTELTENNILPSQLEACPHLQLTTEEQQIQDAADLKTPETRNDSSVNMIKYFGSRMMTVMEFVTKPIAIPSHSTVSKNSRTNAEPNQANPESRDFLLEPETQTVHRSIINPDMTNATADRFSQTTSGARGPLIEPELQTGQGHLNHLEKASDSAGPYSVQAKSQKSAEANNSLVERQPENEQKNSNLDDGQEVEAQLEDKQIKEMMSPEDEILQISKPSCVSVQPDQERSPLEQALCSDSSILQCRIEPVDQTHLTEDSSYLKKTVKRKKKRSQKQVSKSSKYLENQDEGKKNTLPRTLNQKIRTVSKTKKKQETKKKDLGTRQNKKKCSRNFFLNISKNSLYNDQQYIGPEKVPVFNEVKKLKQKRIKGRNGEKSAGLIRALELPCEKKVIKVSEQANKKKESLKRTFENRMELVKKVKTTTETQQDASPVPKQKKTGKIPESTTQKSAKSKITLNNVNKKSHKAKQRRVNKNVSETPAIDQIEQQALLFLKGHKQPQLKVHKLDAKTTGLDHQLIHKSEIKDICGQNASGEPAKDGIENKQLQKKKKAKTLGKKSKVALTQSFHFPASSMNNELPLGTKQKVVRKRKAPAKLDQEIALSPPYSRLIIGCHDCGKSFSEVSALQEHMASMHSENGALQPILPCDVSETPTANIRPSEIMKPNAVCASGFEIHVPTDWDVELEMRDIGLRDNQRNEHRLSFPALSPSPSFPLSATFVEESKHDNTISQELPLGHKKAVGKNSACRNVETNEFQVREQDVASPTAVILSDPKKSMHNKQEVSSDANLVTVEDQNEGGSHISSKLYNISSTRSQKVSDLQEEESSHAMQSHNSPFIQNQLSTKPINAASTYNAGSHIAKQSEIKQEADEQALQTVASQTNSSMTKGNRGRGNKGRGKRQLGKRHSCGNRHTEAVANEEDCQVVFELYSRTGNSKEGNEVFKNRKAINAITASIHPTLKEYSEVQEVCVLPPPVSANPLAVNRSENGSPTLTSGEHNKNSSASSNLRKDLYVSEISVLCQSGITEQGNLQSDNGLSSPGTLTNEKIKVGQLSGHDAQANDGDLLQEVQLILVKAEDQQILNDPHILHDQNMQIHHKESLDGISSGSPTVAQSTAKHCIFYPVKEEEREILVEPQVNNQGTSVSDVTEERTGPWGIPRLEETEVRVGCPQMEMHHNLCSSTEEGSVGADQQSPEDILEFLSQTSDMEDFDGVHSEPEAETHIMSCYHGISANETVRNVQCETDNTEQHGKTSKNRGCPDADDQLASSKEHCEPIDYFIKYFSWSIWKDIAACTQQVSKLPKPVTEEVVAQFVGIHIAMGTLKFPSMKLYWDDFTRVPLIADAMSAAMFSELASNLRLASLRDDNSNGQNGHIDQDCIEILVSKENPLWKVQAIVNRVQKGCRALKRNGNHGVDQYLLPFQRHPTHSLHHTVMVNTSGLVMDFNVRVSDCNREEIVEKMVSRKESDGQGVVFLCKPELSTPSMLEHLLEAGVRSAGKVGGARGQIGDEFVTSDGKLKLFRCHHGFILSAVTKEKSRPTSLVSGFERAIKAANLNRDLRSIYRTPCTSPSSSAWPQSVLWDLIDLALVNSWLQYKQEQTHLLEPFSLMAFRLEVSKTLIGSRNIAMQDSSPPYLPPPVHPGLHASTGHLDVFETPLPNTATRYDGLGHWPEQLSEGEEARCRFGGCDQMSRVRCLKCCVFLCISRNHNCFLKFHSQETT